MKATRFICLLMLSFLFPTLYSMSAFCGPTFNYPRPNGTFSYHGKFQVLLLRKAETIKIGAEGELRKKELIRQGFHCLRKSQTAYICSQKSRPSDWPTSLTDTVNRFLSKLRISFSEPVSVPALHIDTATEQEWIIQDPVKINDLEVKLYKLTYSYENSEIKYSFPVSEDQPLPYVRSVATDQLGVQLVVNLHSEGQTHGYIVEGILQKAP